MKFNEWIEKQGGPVPASRMLKVTEQAVYYWMVRHATPKTTTMQKIVKLSGGQVSLAAIIEETQPKKRARKC